MLLVVCVFAGSTAAPKKKRAVAMAVDDRAFTIDTVMREQLQQLFNWLVDPALVCCTALSNCVHAGHSLEHDCDPFLVPRCPFVCVSLAGVPAEEGP